MNVANKCKNEKLPRQPGVSGTKGFPNVGGKAGGVTTVEKQTAKKKGG